MPEAPLADEAADLAAELARLERLAFWLDARFRIPLTPVRLGLDSLIGLIPGVGDAAAMLPAAYLVWRGWQLGLPRHALARMAANVALDATVGAVPVIGDVFDVAFKANRRNVALLREHLTRRQAAAAAGGAGPRPRRLPTEENPATLRRDRKTEGQTWRS